jgi:hypothetical protein
MAEELADMCAGLTLEQETEADRRIEEFQMQIKEPACFTHHTNPHSTTSQGFL